MRLLLLVLLAFWPCFTIAQTAPEHALRQNDLTAHLRFLASDEMMGRRTGTPQIDLAARYLAEQFRRFGVQPLASLGNDYFQSIPFYRMRHRAMEVRLPEPHPALVMAGSVADLTQRAIWVDDLENAPERDYREMIIVTRTGRPGLTNLPGVMAASVEKRRLARAMGAVALVEVYAEAFPWNQLQAGLQRERFTWDVQPGDLPHLWVAAPLDAARAWAETQPEMHVTSPGLDLHPARSSNVMGVVPGTDPAKRNEYIVLMAHYDHVGAGMDRGPGATPQDSIFNGARDNGMGIVSLLAAAEVLGARPPERSVLIVAFTAEEEGLLGSRYFADNPPIPLDAMRFALNVDTGGYSDTSLVVVVGLERTGIATMAREATSAFGLTAIDDPTPPPGLFGRSDNVNLARKGIPAPTFSPGFRAFTDPGVANYYHRPQDEANDAFDYAYLHRFAQAYVRLARLLAHTDTVPTWATGDPFAPQP